MDRTRLLAELAAAQTRPDDVLYLERQGEDYRWCLGAPGVVQAAPRPDGAPAPDAWMYYSGPWPVGRPAELPPFVADLLAEMESMCGRTDRCRWPLDEPYPLQH